MMKQRVAAWAALTVGVAFSFAPAIFAAQAPPSAIELLVSGDGEGHLGPCSHCPIGVGLGGMSRRATLIASRRSAGGDVLLLDAGNTVFGGESDASDGRVVVESLGAMGYDAVNISYRDFRNGKSSLLAALKGSKFAAVSANILDADSGKPLFNPFVVKTVGGRSIAVIGVTEAPPALTLLPRLKRQLQGVTVASPVEALSQWLPQARTQAPEAVLIYYGSASGLAPIREKYEKDLTAICVGGMSDRAGDVQANVPIVWGEEHGKSLGRAAVAKGAPTPAPVTQLQISPQLEPDPRVAALIQSYAPATQVALAPPDAAPAPQPPAASAPTLPVPVDAQPGPAGTPSSPATLPSPMEAQPSSSGASPAPATQVASAAASEPQPSRPPIKPRFAGAPPRVTAHQPLAPKGLAGVNLTSDQVNASIDRGRNFLWSLFLAKQQKIKNAPLVEDGPDLLALLALVHAGAVEKIPGFEAQLRAYLDSTDPRVKQLSVYEAGIYCMLIEAYGDPIYLPKLRDQARLLVELQGPAGSWGYGQPIAPALVFPAPTIKDRSLQVFGGTPLDGANLAGEVLTRVTAAPKTYDGDNSTSQFALLGLRSAARWRLLADNDVWRRNLSVVSDRENEDGGWDYKTDRVLSYGSMSCAGICAIAIDRFQLGEKQPAADEQLERGLGWLDANFSVSGNPKNGGYLYYYLYSLERVGRILDTEFIGSHEWYPLGARFLVDGQKPSGKWVESIEQEDPRLPTSFALLFLTRATATLSSELARNGSGELRTALTTAPPGRLYVILDASGSMLDAMEGRVKFDIARDAVEQMLSLLPREGKAALRVYGHRKRSIDDGSDEDTELKLSMQPYERDAFFPVLKSLRARGKTPLALSVSQAVDDLGHDEDPTTLVLLTDGGEDTLPRRDPIKAAALVAKLPGVTFHIIGFDVNQQDWNAQLRAMAAAAHGTYWPAPRGADLNRALRAALLGDPDFFSVIDAGGKEVFRGRFGQSMRLPEGKYDLVTPYTGREFHQPFWINTRGTTVVTFDAAAAGVDPTARPITAGGAKPLVATQPAAVRFCSQCGKPLKPGAKFCTNCGAKAPPESP